MQYENQSEFPIWMYAKLKYKCTNALRSFLEARQNNEVVLKF